MFEFILKPGGDNYANCDGMYAIDSSKQNVNNKPVYVNHKKGRFLAAIGNTGWCITSLEYWEEVKNKKGTFGGFHSSQEKDPQDSGWNNYTVKMIHPTIMKPLPKNVEELNAEDALLESLHLDCCITRKTLINNACVSKSIGRSICQGSILLVGSSGVGKSTTLNHMFGLKDGFAFAKTNDNESETRITTEYIIQSDYPDYDVKDLELGIVDTPGFNDTNGVKQDACNFYCIKKFYEEHPNLKGCYPNLIFIMVQATDTRLSGSNSNLGKSLKALKKLNLFDEKQPNVLGILTWSCSVPGKGKQWEQKIGHKKELLQNLIFEFLNIRAPIVAVENDYENNELDIVDNFSKLPDGQLQPKNIYDTCNNILENNKYPLGQLILHACNGKAKNPVLGFKVKAKDANTSNLNAEEYKFFKDFEKYALGGC